MTRPRRIRSWWAAALTAALSTGALVAPRATLAQELIDGIAAQVGSSIVLASEVLQMTSRMEADIRQRGATDMDIARLRAEGLERMIEWRLIENFVARTEMFASDEEVDAAMESIAAENQMTVEELQASVTGHGLTLDDYKAQLKREIERSRALSAVVSSKIRIEDEQLEELYAERFASQPDGGEQVHVRQFLVLYGEEAGRSQEQACEIANAARGRVVAGEPFQQVARADNAIAPERGGELGWLHTGELSSSLLEIVNSLSPGELSEVSVLPFGCNLVQLVDRQEYAPVSYEMARPNLERELRSQAEAQEYAVWIQRMRDRTFIEKRGLFGGPVGPGGPPGPTTAP